MSANHPSKSRFMLRWSGAVVLSAAALLAGCGGSSRVEDYTATRVISFGDELSVVTSAGKKYSVNALNSSDSTKLDCTTYPTWNQYLASNFGLAFPECPGSVTSPNGKNLSAVGAKVADVVSQVNQFLAGDTVSSSTLATLLVGQNDIQEVFAAVRASTMTQAAALSELATRGRTLGALVNRLANGGSGARVLYATVPNLVLSPWGRALSSDEQNLLTTLTQAFNTEFRASVTNDGRYVGLLLAEAELQSITNYPGSYSVTEVTQAGCLTTAVLPDCTTATLQSAASGNGYYYLWADSTRPGPAYHARLGAVAVTRARNNPF